MKTKLCLILALFIYPYSSFAQSKGNTSLDKEISYTNDYEIMQDFKEKIKKLTKNGVELSPEKAKKQLKRTSDRQIHINADQAGQEELTSEEVYQKALHSVVMFGVIFGNTEDSRFQVNTASGYIIDASGIVVTNYHVLEGYVKDPDKTSAMAVRTYSGETYLVKEILSASEETDLAVVQLQMRGDKLQPLPIGESAAIGSTVYVLSHPQHMFYFFSKGNVSRYVERTFAHGAMLKHEMSITSDYGVGSSGGPILDKFGNVVGTVSTTHNIFARPQENKGLQIVVKSAVPVASLKEIIVY